MRYMVPIIIEADSPDEAIAEFTSARYVADVEVGPPMRIDPPADALVPREPVPSGPAPLEGEEIVPPIYIGGEAAEKRFGPCTVPDPSFDLAGAGTAAL